MTGNRHLKMTKYNVFRWCNTPSDKDSEIPQLLQPTANNSLMIPDRYILTLPLANVFKITNYYRLSFSINYSTLLFTHLLYSQTNSICTWSRSNTSLLQVGHHWHAVQFGETLTFNLRCEYRHVPNWFNFKSLLLEDETELSGALRVLWITLIRIPILKKV